MKTPLSSSHTALTIQVFQSFKPCSKVTFGAFFAFSATKVAHCYLTLNSIYSQHVVIFSLWPPGLGSQQHTIPASPELVRTRHILMMCDQHTKHIFLKKKKKYPGKCLVALATAEQVFNTVVTSFWWKWRGKANRGAPLQEEELNSPFCAIYTANHT